MKRILAALASVGTVALLVGAAANSAEHGKAIYAENCKSCHGADGKGSAKKAQMLKVAPETLDLTRPALKKMPRAEVKALIEKGKGKMPGFSEDLKPADVEAVTDYTEHLARQPK
ncbi:MAG TPA: cytochrome c [Myxococcales bacterium]|jgi:mono/diheme cytochrome c family protein